MTDRLTPGMLRDLADLTSNPYQARAFREEAARREAEAKPHVCEFLPGLDGVDACHGCGRKLMPKELGRTSGDRVNLQDSAPHTLPPIGEREGPGSAATHVSACPSCAGGKSEAGEWHETWCELHPRIKNKPAPAADNEAEQLRVIADELSNPRKMIVNRAADRIESLTARVRELDKEVNDVTAQYLAVTHKHSGMVDQWNAEKARADRLAAAMRAALDDLHDKNSLDAMAILDNALLDGGKPNG